LGKAPLSFVLIAVASLAFGGGVFAQSKSADPPPPRAADCPPNTRGTPPTVGGPAAPDLSDRLADSKGVICPPAGVDPDIQVPPPAQGEIKILPAPGLPGGDPSVQPK
jgi:hypothetical protein